MKLNDPHHPRSSLSLVPLALRTLFLFIIKKQLGSCTMHLLRRRTFRPRTSLRHRLWRMRESIPKMSMKTFLSKFPWIHTRLKNPQSPVRLVSRLFTRTTTTFRSSFLICLEGWLWMLIFIINIAYLVFVCGTNLAEQCPHGRACDHKQSTARRYPGLSW